MRETWHFRRRVKEEIIEALNAGGVVSIDPDETTLEDHQLPITVVHCVADNSVNKTIGKNPVQERRLTIQVQVLSDNGFKQLDNITLIIEQILMGQSGIIPSAKSITLIETTFGTDSGADGVTLLYTADMILEIMVMVNAGSPSVQR